MRLEPDQAKAALALLPKREREFVLGLPAQEAMGVIRLLTAFPGSHFVEREK